MIHLSPVRPEDLATLVTIANDPEARHAFGFDGEQARPADVADILMHTRPGTTARVWSIIVGERIVGCIGLAHIHPTHKSAEITNRLIGKGAGWMIGIQAVEKVAEIGFKQLNLHRIECLIHDDNRASILLCERLKRRGLVKEGTARKAVWRSGAWRDVTTYAILREDYRE